MAIVKVHSGINFVDTLGELDSGGFGTCLVSSIMFPYVGAGMSHRPSDKPDDIARDLDQLLDFAEKPQNKLPATNDFPDPIFYLAGLESWIHKLCGVDYKRLRMQAIDRVLTVFPPERVFTAWQDKKYQIQTVELKPRINHVHSYYSTDKGANLFIPLSDDALYKVKSG